MQANDQDVLRAEMVRIGRLMHQFEFVDGTAGNISARIDQTSILTTPSGLAKGFLQPEQLVIVDLQGMLADQQSPAAVDLRPTSEILMHLEAYRRRPDVNAVVHAHPIYAIGLSIAGIPFPHDVIPEAAVVLGPVPTAPYATPSSAENKEAISRLIDQHDAIILAYHGALTVGPDLWNAYLKLEVLEHTAKIIAISHLLGDVKPLPRSQLAKLIAARRRAGGMWPNDQNQE